jgi:cell division protein ZapE
MDLLYSHVALPKKRTHFHKFMLEIHQRIHAENQRLLEKHGRQVNVQLSPGHDAVVNVAGNLAAECRVLCFDEFQITDIADAWIISRLINALWDRGVVLVATSNRPLDDLYQNGLNRRYFLPFIESLKNHSVVLALDSNMDYRVLNNVQADPSYFVPLGSESSVLLYTAYLKYCSRIQNRSSTALTIEVMSGRSLTLPKGLLGEVCWCDFEHLCCQDRGAADYKALCKNFHTIFLDGACVQRLLQ